MVYCATNIRAIGRGKITLLCGRNPLKWCGLRAARRKHILSTFSLRLADPRFHCAHRRLTVAYTCHGLDRTVRIVRHVIFKRPVHTQCMVAEDLERRLREFAETLESGGKVLADDIREHAHGLIPKFRSWCPTRISRSVTTTDTLRRSCGARQTTYKMRSPRRTCTPSSPQC